MPEDLQAMYDKTVLEGRRATHLFNLQRRQFEETLSPEQKTMLKEVLDLQHERDMNISRALALKTESDLRRLGPIGLIKRFIK